MRLRATFLAAMPVFVVSLLLVERLSTFALGLFPASADLWLITIELRGIFRRLSDWIAMVSRHSILLQIAVLLAAMCIVVFAARRRSIAPAFLVNHFALIVIGGIIATTATANVASAGLSDPLVAAAGAVGTVKLTWLSAAILAVGVTGCTICHLIFLRHARLAQEIVALRITELSHDL